MLHPRSVGEADKVAQRIIVPLPSAYPDMIRDRAVAVRIDRLLAAIETGAPAAGKHHRRQRNPLLSAPE
ncbi:hypothetical protein [uncultured Parabacteroides sp.]|uniref:hypothetical protein n=1 Tax=uncultured Parabacteroides sp. TaxID=512312 RepID=UPI0025F0C61B|nr:hypothetical protein [uncultured Parabacteroides sp.]